MEGIIYKIYQPEIPDMIYIGSTINFNRRKCSHKKNTNNKRKKSYKYPLYKYIRECGGWDKFNMEIIERFIYIDKNQIFEQEQHYIDIMKPKLNTNKAHK